MVGQAKMSESNGTARAGPSPTRVAARHTAKLLHNVISLAELQVELFQVELQQKLAVAARPGLLMVAAMGLALGSIPIMLLSLASFLTEVGGLPHALSLLISATAGLTAAMVGVWVGLSGLKRAIDLSQSKDEFSRNVTWIKNALENQCNPANDGCGEKIRGYKNRGLNTRGTKTPDLN